MANKLLSEMGLPKSIANIFAARNLITAKDVFSLTEFELMELLDVDLAVVTSAVAHISEITCPPYQTALSLLEQRGQNENMAGHLPTSLKGIDDALCGGIPFGVVTELVGPAGIEFSEDVPLMLQMAGRILVLRPTSLSEFTDSLQKIKVSLFQHGVKLLIIDSMAALLSGEGVQGPQRQHSLGWHISFIKSVAEFSRIPVVVTNQVRSQSRDETSHYSFQEQSRGESPEAAAKLDSHLVAALGIHWAHAVSIRLIFESKSGQRFIKLAKSPLSPPLAFPFNITSSGILLLNDDGVEMPGSEIHSISCQGHNNVIIFGSEMMH